MLPVSSTAKILLFKFEGKPVNNQWVEWATEMLIAGFDTEELRMLAAENEPCDQVKMKTLTDRIFSDLYLNYSNEHELILNYVLYLVDLTLRNKVTITDTLDRISYYYDDTDELYKELLQFQLFNWAKQDFFYGNDVSGYVSGSINRHNIDQAILRYFEEWRDEVINRKKRKEI